MKKFALFTGFIIAVLTIIAAIKIEDIDYWYEHTFNEENYIAVGMSLGMSIGIAIGSAIGFATNNVGICMCLGVSIGMCIGMAIGATVKRDNKNK